MNCSFCYQEMETGFARVAKRGLYEGSGLFWHSPPADNGKKRHFRIEIGKNIMSVNETGSQSCFTAYSCSKCQKIILDAEIVS